MVVTYSDYLHVGRFAASSNQRSYLSEMVPIGDGTESYSDIDRPLRKSMKSFSNSLYKFFPVMVITRTVPL
jgi:hypothetical protein